MNDQQNPASTPQQENSAQNSAAQVPPAGKAKKRKKSSDSKALWMFAAVFVLFVIVTIFNRKGPQMNWAMSYEQARQAAQQQDKLLMVVMYKEPINQEYTRLLFEQTFTSTAVIDFVEEHFVPVKMNVLNSEYEQISKKLEYNYEPTTVVVDPETEKVLKRRVGNDPPYLFIQEFSEAFDRYSATD